MPDDAKTHTSPQLLSPDSHSLILVDQQYHGQLRQRCGVGKASVQAGPKYKPPCPSERPLLPLAQYPGAPPAIILASVECPV